MKKTHLFWPLLLGLLLADCGTKRIAEDSLQLHRPTEVLGDVVRFTLAYNPGAAFGIDVGPASRIVFITLTIVALVALLAMYRSTPPDHRIQLTALALISGGALGNLIDRVRGPAGVVDFIDVGVGATRFWTFNVADAGITIGAILLALSLWAEPEPEPNVETPPDGAAEDGGPT
ncbi:MAG: signal peptidase II [Longimicrobiales bacterium]